MPHGTFCSLHRAPSRHLTELGVVGTTESAAERMLSSKRTPPLAPRHYSLVKPVGLSSLLSKTSCFLKPELPTSKLQNGSLMCQEIAFPPSLRGGGLGATNHRPDCSCDQQLSQFPPGCHTITRTLCAVVTVITVQHALEKADKPFLILKEPQQAFPHPVMSAPQDKSSLGSKCPLPPKSTSENIVCICILASARALVLSFLLLPSNTLKLA